MCRSMTGRWPSMPCCPRSSCRWGARAAAACLASSWHGWCGDSCSWAALGGLLWHASPLSSMHASVLEACPGADAATQILVNPADPSSHIYKANSIGDAAR